MDPLDIIKQFYPHDTPLFHTLVNHSRAVAAKSLKIADTVSHLNPDREFIQAAAMLHDIGIFLTRAESIGCTGDKPYICHGYLGRQLLDSLALPAKYSLVCERHTGAGITKENIESNDLPLPSRDMVPQSLEEKIICVADKYHSKSPKQKNRLITTQQIIKDLGKINIDHAKRFSIWAKEFQL
ncbi:MAG: HD domain-containing protein [Desulfobacula sp.]|nr:HD domain-containing protein [Desulfobacula sp.]